MSEDEALATKGFVREIAAELASKEDLRALGEELRVEMRLMEARIVTGLIAEMSRMVGIMIEQVGEKIGVVDEKYQDLPSRVTRLEDLEEARRRARRRKK